MSDHLTNLSARITDPGASLRPRVPSLFEPVAGVPTLFDTSLPPDAAASRRSSPAPHEDPGVRLPPTPAARRRRVPNPARTAVSAIDAAAEDAGRQPSRAGPDVAPAVTEEKRTGAQPSRGEPADNGVSAQPAASAQSADDPRDVRQPGRAVPGVAVAVAAEPARHATEPPGGHVIAAPEAPAARRGRPRSALSTDAGRVADPADHRTTGPLTANSAPPGEHGPTPGWPVHLAEAAAPDLLVAPDMPTASALPVLPDLSATRGLPASLGLAAVPFAAASRVGSRTPEPPGEPAPVVHVTIGRIEVRAVRTDPLAESPRPLAPPVMSLDDYVRQRSRGAGP